jgi:hypothetical protein
VPFVLVFTKTDKVLADAVQTNIAAFTGRIAKWFEQLPAVYSCSAITGQGRSELLGVVDEAMAAIQVAAAAEAANRPEGAPSARSKAKKPRKHRPDLNRPW